MSIGEWALRERDEPPSAEVALLRQARDGDRDALDQLIAAHERSLFALCHGILGQAEDAEDAVQETFLRALRSLSGFRADAAFRTWLFRIAVNVCLRAKQVRRPTASWEEDQAPVASNALSPETVALRHLRMTEALGTLDPRQRAILLLKEREGWSVVEIAAGLRCKVRQVEYELSKARRALVEWRRRDAEEGEP